MSLRIGITDTTSRYENYPRWIKGDRNDIEIVKLSAQENNLQAIETCDGVIFSGGVDIHPSYYGKNTDDYYKAPDAFDRVRDDFELAAFALCKAQKKPILGICRGLQIINVALGGTLVLDLESVGKEDHTRHGLTDGIHDVTLIKNSFLFACSLALNGTVNSAHHQSINKVAPNLKITAFSPDMVAEAAEYKDKESEPWLMLVQWHPERLHQTDPGNPLEAGIRKAFLDAISSQ